MFSGVKYQAQNASSFDRGDWLTAGSDALATEVQDLIRVESMPSACSSSNRLLGHPFCDTGEVSA